MSRVLPRSGGSVGVPLCVRSTVVRRGRQAAFLSGVGLFLTAFAVAYVAREVEAALAVIADDDQSWLLVSADGLDPHDPRYV